MTTFTLIVPGTKVTCFDPFEPPNEWVEFTIVSVDEFRVELRSLNGDRTWAHIDEIFLPNFLQFTSATA
ncbi:hypothetical protein HC931_24755 [Candidatus Gracilibacteria bacterium]|nr:hypothetical protein [Candidatus Gracilibacteria bacterium]NJM89789.1 hypothetical protein [Hydrococcus sp. RU_2_2]NJP21681.1 hypothetical protein [Hydrococcus sp. CRU_1_1]